MTPAGVPGTPTAVVATPGNGQVSVAFTAPSNNGSAITSYTVTSNPGGFLATGSSSPVVLGGLANGTAYTFTVHATNLVGPGNESQASVAVTPATVPGPPTGVSATPAASSAVVSFAVPADNGGSTITGYTVTSTPPAAGPTTATASPITVTGLANGTAYTFTVHATNPIGNSIESAATSSVTPATVPDVPTAVTAVSGNGSATVSFAPSANDQGSPISSYTATSTVGGFSQTSLVGSPITVTGLANGTAYTFTVHATNGLGNSAESAASAPVIPAGPPDAPTTVVAAFGNSQASVSFAAPANNEGSPITGYTVTSTPPGTGPTTGTTSPIIVSGLTNGTAYTFTVHATNALGNSMESGASVPVTPASVPSAPTEVVATAGNASASVAFTVPSSSGGSQITGYTVTSSPLGGLSVASTVSPINVTGLTNGQPYTFTVHATNAAGNSFESAPSTPVTPATVPDVPTGVSVTPGNGQVSVNFTPPVNNGGAAVTGYAVTTSTGGVPVGPATTGATSPIIVSGLTNGTLYSFTVVAINPVGPSAASNPVSATPAPTVPNAPTGAAATFGNTTATVAFSPPLIDGGSPITSYLVTSSPGDFTATGPASPLTVTGLTNGVAYTFTVHATNSVPGHSAESAASNSVTPATVPDVPTAAVATLGNGQASVAFSAPDSDGGHPITGYTVTAYTGTLPPVVFTTASGPASPIGVSGLANGTSYTFTVHATNDVGNSAESTASAAVIPATTPGSATNVTATLGNGQASVAFTAPAANGSPITGYTVTSSPGGLTGTGNSSPISVTGLTNGQAYTFTVVATNAIGSGGASGASPAVTPATNPDAPTAVVATAGDQTASVAFAAPIQNGGSAVTSYTVTSSPAGAGPTTGASSPISVTGLTNGVFYTFTVVATNSVGDSVGSTPSTPVETGLPDAPTGLQATGGNAQATITFTPPTNDGGVAITGYTATSTPGGLVSTRSGSPITVGGLTNGTSYTFTVHAINASGVSIESAATNAVIPATVPGAPTAVSAVFGNGSAVVSFSAPAVTGGNAISGYTVTSSPGAIKQAGATSPITISGLTNGTPYTFTVHATNAVGDSIESAASSPVTPATLPGPPTGLTATPGDGTASVAFTAPANAGGSAIINYTATSTPGGITGNATTSPVLITGLTDGTAYTFTIVATNGVGPSVASAASTAVTPASVPGEPTGAVATAGNASASVTFVAPLSNGGAAITGYTVTSSPGNVTSTGATSPIIISGLTNGTPYTFTVHATNIMGASAESAPTATVTPATVPDPPTGVVATASNGSASVAFVAPVSNGGSTVTGYTVTSLPAGGVTNTGTTSPIDVTGLTNGTSYTFTVHATNAIGDSVESVSSASVTPAPIVPDPPTEIHAVANNAQATVTFTAPVNNGGDPITGYKVTSIPGGFTTTAAASPITVGTLINGTSYTFTVHAINAVGSSVESAQSNPVIPATIPNAPTGVTAADGNGQASIAFVPPADNGAIRGDGGNAITGYTVTATTGTGPAGGGVHHSGPGQPHHRHWADQRHHVQLHRACHQQRG